jgi:integrase/recombinase XerD
MARKQGKAPYLSEEEFGDVLRSCVGMNAVRDRAVLLVSYNLGLRAKEIASLRMCDVIDGKGTLLSTIRLLKHMTKGDKFREVFLVHAETRIALNNYLAKRGTRLGDRPLFMSQKGNQFSANTMQRMIGLLYRKANSPGSSHTGRRSFATRLMEKGADIYSIQRLLGHESIATTQEYLYASPERLKKVSGLLG